MSRDGETGVVLHDVTDVEDLAGQTVSLLEDGARRAEMGARNYVHSLQFSLPQSVHTFLEAVSQRRGAAS